MAECACGARCKAESQQCRACWVAGSRTEGRAWQRLCACGGLRSRAAKRCRACTNRAVAQAVPLYGFGAFLTEQRHRIARQWEDAVARVAEARNSEMTLRQIHRETTIEVRGCV